MNLGAIEIFKYLIMRLLWIVASMRKLLELLLKNLVKLGEKISIIE